jgi:hypothetical protein
MGRFLATGLAMTTALGAAGCANSAVRNTKIAPPLIDGALAKPFHSTLLLHVLGAKSVRVCFHTPAVFSAGHQVRPAATSCAPARLLRSLPASYPVQKNLLSVFPHSVWSVTLPRKADPHTLSIVTTARNSAWTVRNSSPAGSY